MEKTLYLKSIKIGIVAFALTYLLRLVNSFIYSFNFNSFFNIIELLMLAYSGIIYGVVFGILYVKYYDKLYGNNNIIKAVELILLIWFFAGYIPVFVFDFPYYIYRFEIIPYLHSSFLLYINTAMIFGLLWPRNHIMKKNENKNIQKGKSFTSYPINKEKIKTDHLELRLRKLINKDSSLILDDVEKLLNKGFFTKESLKEAENLLNEKEKNYDSYTKLKKEFYNLKNKMILLTDRVAEGEVDSESYKRAADDLDSQMKVLEEKLWKLRNKLFKDDYEKPF